MGLLFFGPLTRAVNGAGQARSNKLNKLNTSLCSFLVCDKANGVADAAVGDTPAVEAVAEVEAEGVVAAVRVQRSRPAVAARATAVDDFTIAEARSSVLS